MRLRGITLLELLVVAAMLGVMVGGITRGYLSAVEYEARMRASREEAERFQRFENQVSNLLTKAFVSTDPADAATFFIAGDPQGAASDGDVQTITFTTIGQTLTANVVASESDFETLNANYGPQGGVCEVTLGTLAMANPNNSDGLFLREQRPSDGDPSQGGYERLLVDELAEIRFEFFDGLDWVTTWDTREMATKRIPSAIRVGYILEGEEERTLIVRLPLSDVTPDNPLTVEGGDL